MLDEVISSVAVMVILVAVPIWASSGVPVRAPVLVLKLAQLGLPVMLKSKLPDAAESIVGVKP